MKRIGTWATEETGLAIAPLFLHEVCTTSKEAVQERYFARKVLVNKKRYVFSKTMPLQKCIASVLGKNHKVLN